MHVVKRKGPKLSEYGKPVGRRPLGEKTLTCAVHLDHAAGLWLQKTAHNRGVSQSRVLRDLVMREMAIEKALKEQQERMDLLSASA